MDIVEEKLPIGPEEVAEAAAVLQKYKAGKAALDKRLVDNELWFRMGHWKNYQNPMMEGKPQPSSGWLFNSIANKHADAMDNYPAPNVLPRAADDEQTARVLSSILPVVLEQADYEQVYSDTWWRKLKQGTGVKGVFWDPEQRGGVGEIAIRPMNLLMLYWEPGVDDIQASPHFFSLSLADTAQLESRWPQLAGHTASVLDVPHYIHDGGLDTSDKSVVVDWYYKKLSPEGRSVLHYCKFCNGVVLYASENDPALAERGFYDHGRYPFVFDALFMEEDSPAGFGYIDVMKECQTAIDKMNHAMDENVLLSSRQRYVLSDTAGVNEEELTDLSRDIIHVVAAVVMEKAKRAHRAGNDHEYLRLLAERNGILQLAREHCVTEMLQSGRCPHCKGTGIRPRKGDDCPKCHGTGRVVPDAELVSRRFGHEMRQAVERAVDEVIHQASDLSKLMDRQVREMRAA